LWWLAGQKLFLICAPVFQIIRGIALAGSYQFLVQRIESAAKRKDASSLRRFLANGRTWVLKHALSFFGYYRKWTAKQIITQSVLARQARDGAVWLLGLACTFILWLIPVSPIGLAVWYCSRWCHDKPLAVGLLLADVVVLWAVYAARGHLGRWALKRFLASFDLQKDLATPFILKPLFIRLFDRDYYGRMDIDEVVSRALEGKNQPIENTDRDKSKTNGSGTPTGKRLDKYCDDKGGRVPIIYVAVVAANVSTGQLETIAGKERVVDALVAATSVVPFFRVQQLHGEFYIDGVNVANEPTYAIMRLLQKLKSGTDEEIRMADRISSIEIYAVSPVPLTKAKLNEQTAQADRRVKNGERPLYSGLVEGALRALRLQRFQDARMERQLVKLYRRALASRHPFDPFLSVEGRTVIGADLHPIEPDRALNLNERVLIARDRYERRKLMVEAVADGCRASLEVMLAQTIKETAGSENKPIKCQAIIDKRLVGEARLPGSAANVGPGVAEVCRQCAINRGKYDSEEPSPQHLRVRPLTSKKADWPKWKENSNTQPVYNVEPTPDTASPQPPVESPVRWPWDRNGVQGSKRPTISLLFSGGVFRGVFQIGVVNALNEVGLQPDLLAGASVGSITAALVAKVFHCRPEHRPAQIARLAGTFLAIDRLVLTDRLADFVRRLTLRAADSHFSLRDADQFFRRYDLERFGYFNERSRRVIAGLERLFYLNPFELKDLTKALRNGNTAEVHQLFGFRLQGFLNRSGVGQEILGTEPLELLIRELVLPEGSQVDPDSKLFNFFLTKSGIQLLATTTNLTQGELNILSSEPEKPTDHAILKDGLLASSAFPAVFRPRMAWEVFLQTNREDQLVDGGVMDNLPLDAVARFLNRACSNKRIAQRPRVNDASVPHLLFTASLEVKRRNLQGRELQTATETWLALMTRARQLRYNQKIEKFAEAQTDFRAIYEHLHPSDWDLLDIEVVVVKPEWLPGTFAFNPMLGFRRSNQAASIAHGCASTLAELHRTASKHPDWASGWGVKDQFDRQAVQNERLVPTKHGENICWFRQGVRCPFSSASLREQHLAEETVNELAKIYDACGKRSTHQAR